MRHTELFEGRIGSIDEPKDLGNGNWVVNFSVAETPRVKQGNDWVDGVTIWTNVAIFGDEARNLARSVEPGTFVVVSGTRKASEFVDKKTGEKRSSQSVIADTVAVSITKFNYVEGIGNVNYAKGETGSVAPKAKAKAKATAPQTDVFADAASDDVFGGGGDPFDLV